MKKLGFISKIKGILKPAPKYYDTDELLPLIEPKAPDYSTYSGTDVLVKIDGNELLNLQQIVISEDSNKSTTPIEISLIFLLTSKSIEEINAVKNSNGKTLEIIIDPTLNNPASPETKKWVKKIPNIGHESQRNVMSVDSIVLFQEITFFAHEQSDWEEVK